MVLFVDFFNPLILDFENLFLEFVDFDFFNIIGGKPYGSTCNIVAIRSFIIIDF